MGVASSVGVAPPIAPPLPARPRGRRAVMAALEAGERCGQWGAAGPERGPGPGPGRSAPAAGSAPRHRPFALAAPRPAAPPLPPPRAAAAVARGRFSGRGSLPPPARRGCPEPPPADSLEAAAGCAEPPRRLLASDQPGTSLGRAGDGARCSFFFSGSGGGGGPGGHGSAGAASMSPLRCAGLGPGCGCGCRPAPPAPHCRAGTRAGGEQKAAEGGGAGGLGRCWRQQRPLRAAGRPRHRRG